MPKSVHTDAYRCFLKILVQARTDAGFTQQQLADRLGKPQSYVSKYESGERRLDVVEFVQAVHALGMDAAPLLDRLQAYMRSPK